MQADGFSYLFAEQIYRMTDIFKVIFGKRFILVRDLKALERVEADIGYRRAIMPLECSRAVFRKRADPCAEF